jgi:hypothetical protein
MADDGDVTTRHVHHPWPLARSQVKPSTCKQLLAKVVEPAAQYGAEDAPLDDHGVNEIADEEEWALDEKSYQVMRKSL